MAQHGDNDAINNLITQLFRRELVQQPSKYDGSTNIEEHINEVEEYMRLINLNDEKERIIVLSKSLDEESKSLLIMQNDYDENKDSYTYMKEKILKLTKT